VAPKPCTPKRSAIGRSHSAVTVSLLPGHVSKPALLRLPRGPTATAVSSARGSHSPFAPGLGPLGSPAGAFGKWTSAYQKVMETTPPFSLDVAFSTFWTYTQISNRFHLQLRTHFTW